MAKINSVVFWLDGVFTHKINNVIMNRVVENGNKFTDHNLLINLYEKLACGSISVSEYVTNVKQIFSLDISLSSIVSNLLLAESESNQLFSEIELIKGKLDTWLIIDYPSLLYDLLDRKLIDKGYFSKKNIIFLENSKLNRMNPDVFYYLNQYIGQPAESCLFIDPSVRRSIESINHGFPSHHYISPRLIKREFYLRGFSGPVKIH